MIRREDARAVRPYYTLLKYNTELPYEPGDKECNQTNGVLIRRAGHAISTLIYRSNCGKFARGGKMC